MTWVLIFASVVILAALLNILSLLDSLLGKPKKDTRVVMLREQEDVDGIQYFRIEFWLSPHTYTAVSVPVDDVGAFVVDAFKRMGESDGGP